MHPEARDESKSLVKTITIQSHFNISCSVISDDGKFLAASDAVSLYIFSLDVSEDEDGIFDILPRASASTPQQLSSLITKDG